MAQLTEQAPLLGGTVPTYAAVAAADYFIPASRGSGARYLIHIKNAGASPDNVKINDPTSLAPAGATTFDSDLTVTVTNATEKMILIDNIDRWVDPATGRVDITNSFITSVTIGIFRVI
jgi:hypothetical protein